MRRMAVFLVGFWSLAACEGADEPPEHEALACEPAAGDELFERRIAPLLADDRPSSCNECHLRGLDLGSFAKGTPCRSMACMAEQGIVDLEHPENSLLLSWIERADPEHAGSELITEAVVAEEYDAMLSWISYSARCGAEACEPIEDPCGDPPTHEDCELALQPERDAAFVDPGDCSEATLESLFDARVYTWRGRCFPCHFQDDDIDAPKWVAVGSCALGASRTMRQVLTRGLVDVDDPERSLLLLKPLDESVGGVEHGGHHKMASTEDPAYVDFVEWITRYAECQR